MKRQEKGCGLYKALVVAGCIAFCGCAAGPTGDTAPTTALAAAPTAGPIAGLTAQSLYGVYYGDWDDALVKEVTGKTGQRRYDLLIVHPDTNITPAHVSTLQAAGITVLCYLTVGEDDTLHTAAASDGRSGPAAGYASWYYDADQDGRPDQNPDWGSYYTNPADPHWRAALRTYRNTGEQHWYGVDYMLTTLRCDGLFLDTIGTVRPAAWGGRYAAQLNAMLDLIAELRAQLGPARLLVINRGLFYFDPYDATTNPHGLQEITPAMRDRLRGLINGLLYEEFLHEEHREAWAARLNAEATKPDGFTVFALDYQPLDTPATCTTVRALGWLPHISTTALDTFAHVVRDQCP